MATVSIHMPENSGLTGFTLFLRKTSDGTLVNTGGDALTESPTSSGRFTATVTESWTETLAAVVLDGSSLAVRDGWLASGETLVKDGYPAAGAGDASQSTLLEVLSLVSSATITTTGYARLDANGVLLLKRGDTSAITFTSTTSNVVPDTSASTTKVFFGVRDAAGRNFVTIEGTKLVNTGLQSYRFSPTAAQAKLIPKGKHYFDVMAMYGYTAGTEPAEGKPGTPATYTSLRTFVSGRCDVDDLMIEPSEVY